MRLVGVLNFLLDMELDEQFLQASKRVQTLKAKPSNDILLKLYALYKQGSEGDVNGERPGGFDFRGAAKFDAWSKVKGMAGEEAKQQYIDLVDSLFS
jgi:diazepam-binding inhibitor (GABA receptor modulating acyl-CoA-binding protein)